MSKMIGKASIRLENEVYIESAASVVGKKEGEGPLASGFDEICMDDRVGAESWEEAESNLQKKAVWHALKKAGLKPEQIRYMFAGDLLGQCMATAYGLEEFAIPLFGVYGACSTCGEAMSLASMAISAGYADKCICVTSSHFSSAEKEFRFPLEYGNQRPLSATWTVTGSGAFVLSRNQTGNSLAKITEVTTGKVVDYGIKDSMNMGACMAPAAMDLIWQHFEDHGRKPDYFDKIITGDLGSVGQTLLLKLLRTKGYDLSKVHMDCGMKIFDPKKQDTHSGGSGCGCAAVTLAGYILPKIQKGDWKRVLFLPTGALLSKTSFNEGKSVPGIAHGVVIERV